MSLPDLVVPHRNGFEFGVGFDAGSSSLRRTAVVGDPNGVKHAGGPEAQKFDVSKITSTHELATKLSIDVQASAGCGAFGASASARFGYMEESKVQSSSLFMTLTASIILEDLSIGSPDLAPDAASLVDKPDVFHERYGDMFARGCSRGGLFVGVLQIDTRDSDQVRDITASLNGSYGSSAPRRPRASRRSPNRRTSRSTAACTQRAVRRSTPCTRRAPRQCSGTATIGSKPSVMIRITTRNR